VAEWIVGADGVRLRAALFPVAHAIGSVVLSPGRTEPIEKYYEVVEELRARGFVVLVHDWRGHGLSQRLTEDPLRGHASGWQAYVGDFRRVLDAFADRLPGPWLAMGHSMGGGLTALALTEGETRFAAAVLSAPMFGVQVGQPPVRLVRAVIWLMLRSGQGEAYAAGAGDPLGGSFEHNVLTHDRARWERTHALLVAHPELQLAHVTWGWLDFAFKTAERLAEFPAGGLTLPLLVVTAAEERLVDNAAARAFVAKVPGARHVQIEGAYHELLMETDDRRAVFWAAFDRLVAEVI
jgi:lysophospholipase